MLEVPCEGPHRHEQDTRTCPMEPLARLGYRLRIRATVSEEEDARLAHTVSLAHTSHESAMRQGTTAGAPTHQDGPGLLAGT